jgi:hypothetical protein
MYFVMEMFQVHTHGGTRGATRSMATRLWDVWSAVWIPAEAWRSYVLQYVRTGYETQSTP